MNIYPNGYPGEPKEIVMNPGDTLHIPQQLTHQFIGLEDSYRLVKGD